MCTRRDAFLIKKKEILKLLHLFYYVLIFFFFLTRYFGDTHCLIYEMSNFLIYLFVLNCQFSPTALSGYSLQSLKCFIKLLKPIETPFFPSLCFWFFKDLNTVFRSMQIWLKDWYHINSKTRPHMSSLVCLEFFLSRLQICASES